MSCAVPFNAYIIPKAHLKRESNLLKPGRLGGGAADQGAANAVFSMRGISPSGWICQQGQVWRWICRGEAGASEMRPYQGGALDLHPALSSPSATPLRSGGYAGKVKRDDGTSASAEATKKNAPQRKVGARRRVRGASAGERRDSGSRDATPSANEARRRYPADEAS